MVLKTGRFVNLTATLLLAVACKEQEKPAPAATAVPEPKVQVESPSPTPSPLDVDALAKKCVGEELDACKLACDQGHARSCSLFGLKMRMAEMKGTAEKGTALAAHKKACELGDGFGCYESQQYEKGMTLMAEQCDKDDAMACRSLGFAKNFGKHTEKDEKAALALFAKACKLGDETGCLNEKRLGEK